MNATEARQITNSNNRSLLKLNKILLTIKEEAKKGETHILVSRYTSTEILNSLKELEYKIGSIELDFITIQW